MPNFYQGPANDPSSQLVAVTPSDSADLAMESRALYVGTGGNISVIAAGDTAAVTLSNVPSGAVLPIRVRRVRATGTTATAIVALY